MTANIHSLLEDLDAKPTPAAYARAARTIDRLAAAGQALRPVRLALASSFTVDVFVPYVKVEAARRGFAAEVYVAPFNSVQQELLGEDSGLAQFQPEGVFVSQLLEDVAPELTSSFLTLSPGEIVAAADRVVDSIRVAVEEFRRRSHAVIFVHNYALPERALLGLAECGAKDSQTDAIRSLNRRLSECIAKVSGAFVLDYERSCAEVGYRRCRDPKTWYIGRVALSSEHMPHLAAEYAAALQSSLSQPKKCLAVDLDNTLWGGVLGEDGMAGISIGRAFPGNSFLEFQQSILDLHRRGVILAVASKNNHDEAVAALEEHPEMLLRPAHFSAMRINWNDKPQNIREIASELNIGVDSIVFFDDNPAERALMREALPEVTTLEPPADPAGYVRCLQESRCFDQLAYSEEDWRRGELYRAQSEREELRTSARTLQDFYEGLEMCIAIEPVDDWTMDRVHALIHKTNQFNVTTRRHSQAALQSMRGDPRFTILTVRLKDRFGDNGIIGATILENCGEAARIDTLLLSCRVIGRTVETAVLCRLAERAKEQGAGILEGQFIPTKKNQPAADLFSQHGFVLVETNAEGVQTWLLDLERRHLDWPAYISVEDAQVTTQA